MTAADLAALNGLLSLEVAERARLGENRDQREIADDVLRDAEVPDLRPINERITRMIARRNLPPPNRVLP